MAKSKRYYDKKMENTDSSMGYGPTGHANMPKNVIIKDYPKEGPYMNPSLNDGISGIDKQRKSDVNDTTRQKPDSKY